MAEQIPELKGARHLRRYNVSTYAAKPTTDELPKKYSKVMVTWLDAQEAVLEAQAAQRDAEAQVAALTAAAKDREEYWEGYKAESLLTFKQLSDDFDRLTAELESQLAGKWISVDVEMPKEEDREFWCWLGPNDGILASDGTLIKAAFANYMKIVKTYRSVDGSIKFSCGCLEKVTHYQPLPSPPTKEKL
jgi:hypothetical protein